MSLCKTVDEEAETPGYESEKRINHGILENEAAFKDKGDTRSDLRGREMGS